MSLFCYNHFEYCCPVCQSLDDEKAVAKRQKAIKAFEKPPIPRSCQCADGCFDRIPENFRFFNFNCFTVAFAWTPPQFKKRSRFNNHVRFWMYLAVYKNSKLLFSFNKYRLKK